MDKILDVLIRDMSWYYEKQLTDMDIIEVKKILKVSIKDLIEHAYKAGENNRCQDAEEYLKKIGL